MEGEEQTIAPTEQAAPAIESQATTEPAVIDEPEMIPDPGEETGDGNEPEPPILDVIEVEWDDGKKYQIPKALEGGLLKNKDYTQGKQQIAETRRQLESREAEITQKLAATDAELDARAELRTVSTTLAEFAKLTQADWDAHHATDPLGTDRAWRQYQFLKDQKADLEGKIGKAQTERTEKAQQDLAKRVQETLTHAEKNIPGFKPDTTIPTLVEFATKLGVPEEEIKRSWSPIFVDLLHRAHVGTIALQKQATAPRLPTAPIEPLATVGGKSTPGARTDLASLDMDAYVAARKKGIGGKALR